MPIELATVCAWIVEGYLLAGCGFAAWFVTRGVGRIDATAQHGTLGFRVLLFPGSALLWPWLVRRCRRVHREEHA